MSEEIDFEFDHMKLYWWKLWYVNIFVDPKDEGSSCFLAKTSAIGLVVLPTSQYRISQIYSPKPRRW